MANGHSLSREDFPIFRFIIIGRAGCRHGIKYCCHWMLQLQRLQFAVPLVHVGGKGCRIYSFSIFRIFFNARMAPSGIYWGSSRKLVRNIWNTKKKRSQTDGHIATHLSVVIEWGKLCYCTWTSSRKCIVFGPVALAMDFAILLYFYQCLNCMPTID